MSFDLESFKLSLTPFGTLKYAQIFNEGKEQEHLEFAVDNVNYLYAVANFGELVSSEILPRYPTLIVLSMDRIRLKGAFTRR